MKNFKLIYLTIIFFNLSIYGQNKKENITEKVIPSSEFNVSLVRLIATPEKYDGKIIQVIGYLNIEFEGTAIYLHQEDYEKGLTNNGFWVDFSKELVEKKNLKDYSKNYVIIVGKFDMNSKGHKSLFGGMFKEISRLDYWK